MKQSIAKDAPPKKWTDPERIAAQRKCIDRHFELERTQHPERVDRIMAETFANDGVYYQMVAGVEHFEGFSAICDFYRLLFNVLPDLDIRITHAYDIPGSGVREGIVHGTHSGEFAGISASGRRIVFPFCGIYIFGDDPTRLLAERAYWDNDGVLRQMRGETVVATTELPWDATK